MKNFLHNFLQGKYDLTYAEIFILIFIGNIWFYETFRRYEIT